MFNVSPTSSAGELSAWPNIKTPSDFPDRAVLLEEALRPVEELHLGVVGAAHDDAGEKSARVMHARKRVGQHSTRRGLGQGQSLFPRPQEIADDFGQRVVPGAPERPRAWVVGEDDDEVLRSVRAGGDHGGGQALQHQTGGAPELISIREKMVRNRNDFINSRAPAAGP